MAHTQYIVIVQHREQKASLSSISYEVLYITQIQQFDIKILNWTVFSELSNAKTCVFHIKHNILFTLVMSRAMSDKAMCFCLHFVMALLRLARWILVQAGLTFLSGT